MVTVCLHYLFSFIFYFIEDFYLFIFFKFIKGIPYIYGDTKEEERRKWLMTFKDPLSKLNVIGLSQVGDTVC